MIPALKTKRLKLGTLTFSDRDAMISAIMSDRDVMRWLPYSHAVSTPQGQREVAVEYLKDFINPWNELGYGVWAVCIGTSELGSIGELFGYCGFLPEQMKGAGPEIERVYAATDRGNLASRTVMEQSGMAFEKEVDLYDSVVRDAEEPDCVNLAALSLGVWLTSWVYNKSIGFYKKFGFKDLGKHDFKLGDESIENRVLHKINRRL